MGNLNKPIPAAAYAVDAAETLSKLVNDPPENWEWGDRSQHVHTPFSYFFWNGLLVQAISYIGEGELIVMDENVNPAAIQNEIADLQNQISSIDTDVSDLVSRMNAFDTRLNGVDTRLNGVDTKINTINGQISTISGQISTINSQISTMSTQISNKVDKVSGKGLSTNDFTTALLSKLNGIEAGANKTVVDSSLSSTSINALQNKAVYSGLATKSNLLSKFYVTLNWDDELLAFSGNADKSGYTIIGIVGFGTDGTSNLGGVKSCTLMDNIVLLITENEGSSMTSRAYAWVLYSKD